MTEQEQITIPEASIKNAVSDFLTYGMNQGKWWFCRLNAGSFIIKNPDGSPRRRVVGAPKGAADFVVFQGNLQELPICEVTFIECKSSNGKTSKEQDEFAEVVTKQHARYFVIRDAEQLNEILDFQQVQYK